MRLVIKVILLMLLGFNPSNIFSQNNRLTIQTGLFHLNFDKTPLINKSKTITHFNWKVPHSYFGGYLNESLGFQYQRKIIKNNFIGMEFMSRSCSYYLRGFTPEDIGPFIVAKNTKKVNLIYSYKYNLNTSINLTFTSGINYIWGNELVYLYTPQSYGSWYEPQFGTIVRSDFGTNLRVGFEYSPLKWITLYSDLDFLGIFYLRKISEKDSSYALPATYEFFKENYGVNYLPSRWDLSWQLGIGFNFGK